VPLAPQEVGKMLLQFEAGMVGADGDAGHGGRV
jgi:hypothetical protein